MGEVARFPIVLHQTFIEATRDTGYRSTAAAVAELVDNSIQASAKNVQIFIRDEPRGIELAVIDDGTGMDSPTLRRALQFGGSQRFGDRAGLGRFGMGLPNASVSQARRVEVFTWRAPNVCLASHLDVDEISAGNLDEIPTVRRCPVPEWAQDHKGFSGTLVVWTKCDRLDNRRASTIGRKLLEPIGRIFRHFIWGGVKITLNSKAISPIDPLFLHASTPMTGAKLFGEPLAFEVRVPGKEDKTSMVSVRFAELPVTKWHDLHVDEKRKHRIVDGAGLSILRAGREVDYGWWFFGAKRRENYDSWWRGELSFEPELDELFAITHSKQGINPTPEIREVLTPDLEAAARQLNSRVQAAFASVKEVEPPKAAATASEPLSAPTIMVSTANKPIAAPPVTMPVRNGTLKPAVVEKEPEADYDVLVEEMRSDTFFTARDMKGRWQLLLNSSHPFYTEVYEAARPAAVRRHFELMLLAHGKAEAKRGRKGFSWAGELADLLGGDE